MLESVAYSTKVGTYPHKYLLRYLLLLSGQIELVKLGIGTVLKQLSSDMCINITMVYG